MTENDTKNLNQKELVKFWKNQAENLSAAYDKCNSDWEKASAEMRTKIFGLEQELASVQEKTLKVESLSKVLDSTLNRYKGIVDMMIDQHKNRRPVDTIIKNTTNYHTMVWKKEDD